MKINLISELTGGYIRGAAKAAARTRGEAETTRAEEHPWQGGPLSRPSQQWMDDQGQDVSNRTIARGETLVKLNRLRRSGRFWRNNQAANAAEIEDQGFVSGSPK